MTSQKEQGALVAGVLTHFRRLNLTRRRMGMGRAMSMRSVTILNPPDRVLATRWIRRWFIVRTDNYEIDKSFGAIA